MKDNNIINTFKTIKEVEDYRNMVNEMCDKRHEFIILCEEADCISKKSFNYIKESFEALSPMLFKTTEGKKLINKYTKLIRESKNLSSLHTINENIRKAGKDTDVDYFVSTLTSVNWNVNPDTVKEDTNKLGRVLAEAYLLIGKEAKDMLPSENLTLSNAISFIAESNKNSKNISNFSDASKIIKEHIKTNGENKNMFESKNLDELAKNLINEFNAKYSNEFSDEEISVLKEVSCSNNREDVFIKYKTNCINKIIEAKHNFEAKGDKTSSERLNTILEQVSNKYFALESVGSDICSLIQLTKIFE